MIRIALVNDGDVMRLEQPLPEAYLRAVYGETECIVYEPGDEVPPDPQPSLQERQAPVWRSIKEERERRRVGGVAVSGKWFHTDDPSRIQHMGLVMMGQNIPAVQWKTMDGSFVTMTPELAQQIFQTVAAADIANFTTAETHRARMIISDDPANYDFSSGWLAIYEGA